MHGMKEGVNNSIAAQRVMNRVDTRQVLQVMAVTLAKKSNAVDARFRARPSGLSARGLLCVSLF